MLSKIDGFFTIMCDECTNREQLVICLRWVDKSCLEVHEDFIGLYSIPDIAAGTILGVIKDTLSRLNLGFNRCRGQCYDGASNMSGHKSGIAKSITDIESRALYTHCYGHSLNLAVGNTIKNIKILTDVMDIIHEMSALIKFSPKRDVKFEAIKKELEPDTPSFRVLCPTRWTVRSCTMKSVLDNYAVLQQLWDDCLEEHLQSDIKARIIGIQAQMKEV